MDIQTVETADDRREPSTLPSILTLTLCAFAVTTAEFVIAGILPDVAAGLSVSIPSAGHLVTAYAVGMIVGGPMLTLLTVGIPRKPLIVTLLAVFIIGNLFAAAAPNYFALLAARFVSGLVVSTFFAMAVVVAASLVAPGKQAPAVAQVALGFNLAMILGAPLGTLIGQQFGWRATFLAIAFLATVALAFLVKFVPVRGVPTTGSVAGELRILKSHDLLLALAMTAVGNAGVLMVFVYLAPLLTGIGGFAAETVPVLLLVYGVGATFGNVAGGWLSDRGADALYHLSSREPGGCAGAVLVRRAGAAFRRCHGVRDRRLGLLGDPGMQTRVLVTAKAAPTLGIALNASGFQIAAAFAA